MGMWSGVLTKGPNLQMDTTEWEAVLSARVPNVALGRGSPRCRKRVAAVQRSPGHSTSTSTPTVFGGAWASRTQKHSEAGYGKACGQRRVDNKTSQTTPATTSTSPIRQLLGDTDTQTAHPATSSTAPTHQLLRSANAETTPAGAPAAAADRTQRPDATCEGKNG